MIFSVETTLALSGFELRREKTAQRMAKMRQRCEFELAAAE
jgi:hypothetical protein